MNCLCLTPMELHGVLLTCPKCHLSTPDGQPLEFNTPTPETDAYLKKYCLNDSNEIVLLDFARKLERERDEARKERDEWGQVFKDRDNWKLCATEAIALIRTLRPTVTEEGSKEDVQDCQIDALISKFNQLNK